MLYALRSPKPGIVIGVELHTRQSERPHIVAGANGERDVAGVLGNALTEMRGCGKIPLLTGIDDLDPRAHGRGASNAPDDLHVYLTGELGGGVPVFRHGALDGYRRFGRHAHALSPGIDYLHFGVDKDGGLATV